MTRTLTLLLIILVSLLHPVSLRAQGCETMSLSFEHYEPCKFRAKYAITADCYNQINVSLDQGEFFNLEANVAEGWVIEQLSPSELLITNSNGVFPNGSSWFMNFSYFVVGGGTPNLILLYDNTCVMEGCETILVLDACPSSCVSGIVYRECEEDVYFDQPGLENWVVQLLDNAGNVQDELLSGMDGTYEFCDVSPGEYTVRLEVPNGWTPIFPASGMLAVTVDPGVNPTARFGACPDCGCDLVDLVIQQEASTTDTAFYSVSMFSASAFCFESLDIEVLEGTLIGWDIDLPGWSVEEVIPGHLHIEPFYPFILEELLQDLRIQVVSSDTAHIYMAANWKAKQKGKCETDERFPSPPKNYNVTCCPTGMVPGPELVDNGHFGLLTPPSTDYAYGPGPLSSGENYIMDQAQAFASNPAWVCPGIFNIWDMYLAVDGSTNNSLFAWKQQVTGLTANTEYIFCAWLNNLVKPGKNFNFPVIELVIQDDFSPFTTWTSTPLILPESPDVWVNHSINWTAPASPSASYTIKIRSLDISAIGNDFAIDQISFRSCTPVPDTCICNDPEMILTQNGIDYPLACTKGAPTFVLPCPVNDVVISGFFGCESVNGGLCDETVVNWEVSGPNNVYLSGSTTNFPSVQFLASSINAPGTYQLNLSTLCPGSTDSCVCTARWIQEACDTCHCGGFDHLYLRGPQGAPSQPLICGGPPITLVCPDPGQGFTITGNFACEGDTCPNEHLIEWGLTQPDGTIINMSFWDNDPLFGITLLPNYFNQSGVYTLNLTGYCGDDTCHCELTFIVDCPNQCPCDIANILALQQQVNKGFAVSVSNKSCKACFSPLALSKCEQVDWYLNSTNGTPIGSTWGNQTFCYLFPGSGTYTVVMQVTRWKPDGSLCESFAKTQTVSVSCIVWPDCATSILKNHTFSENGVPGDIAPGGMGSAPGWMAAEGHPTLLEGQFSESLDGWVMKLNGNYDQSDILMTEEIYCLSLNNPKGNLIIRHWGDPHENLNGKHIKDWKAVKAKQGQSSYPCDTNEEECFTLARFEDMPAPEEGDWYVTEIPYDITGWTSIDSCGDGNAGIPIRLAVSVWNHLSEDQCACPVSHTIYLDNICFDATLVSTNLPPIHELALRAYPNPTTGLLQVALPTAIQEQTHLEVYDLTGRMLIRQVVPVGEQAALLDLASLSGGMYFLRWTSRTQVLSRQRIVKD